jgi:DNA-binding XRE family transcriptional regulator
MEVKEELKDAIRKVKNYDELLDVEYGKIGTEERSEFEVRADQFVISEMLKASRKEAGITQEQLAQRTGTKKIHISRLENGKYDIPISVLYRIFEQGLGKTVSLQIC